MYGVLEVGFGIRVHDLRERMVHRYLLGMRNQAIGTNNGWMLDVDESLGRDAVLCPSISRKTKQQRQHGPQGFGRHCLISMYYDDRNIRRSW